MKSTLLFRSSYVQTQEASGAGENAAGVGRDSFPDPPVLMFDVVYPRSPTPPAYRFFHMQTKAPNRWTKAKIFSYPEANAMRTYCR